MVSKVLSRGIAHGFFIVMILEICYTTLYHKLGGELKMEGLKSGATAFEQEMRDLKTKYDDSIKVIIKRLKLPETIEKAKVEALLIMATNEHFATDTLKRDIVLMAIGLLKGYSRHCQPRPFLTVEERYTKFLKESNCNIKRNTLIKRAERYIDGVTHFLEEIIEDEKSNAGGKIAGYIEVAAKKHPSSYIDYIPDDELPSLINIKEAVTTSVPPLHLLPIPVDVYNRETYGYTAPLQDSAWGDSGAGGHRQGYMTRQVKAGILGGSIVFNSVYDGRINKGYGFDERNFLSVRNIPNIPHANPGEWHTKEIAAKNGFEYEISCYIHNNNPGGCNAEARNTKVSVEIPKEDSSATGSIIVKGHIQSDNASPGMYWSSVCFTGDQRPFSLEYISGSARLHNSGIGSPAGGLPLDDAIVAEDSGGGVLIGYNDLDGIIPGGIDYASYVTMRVKAKDFIKHEVIGMVRSYGDRKWKKCITDVDVGDRLEFQFEFRNNSVLGEIMENITLKIQLPVNTRYVSDSARLWTADCSGAKIDPHGELTDIGVNIGDYAPDANAIVRFATEVMDTGMGSTGTVDVCWAQVYKDNASVSACASVMYRNPHRVAQPDSGNT